MVKRGTGITDPADGADCSVNQLPLTRLLDDAGLRGRLWVLSHFTQLLNCRKSLEHNKNLAALQTSFTGTSGPSQRRHVSLYIVIQRSDCSLNQSHRIPRSLFPCPAHSLSQTPTSRRRSVVCRSA